MPDSQLMEKLSAAELLASLSSEIEAAQQRVYRADRATPCDAVALPDGRPLWLKREDTARVHSYKWRGAFNKLACLIEQGFQGTVVAASAGNHAQGVALAAQKMAVPAVIYMPRTTPLLKQEAVRRLGRDWVEVRLVGDRYDQAAQAARQWVTTHDCAYLHPFDDLQVIAGQATIATELDEQISPDLVLLEIGGGGMAAGVASVVRRRFPSAKIVGVEVIGQNSMQMSLQAGHPITLPQVTRFCDGTAVATPGQLTFALCRELLDDVWVVDERQVCTAIEWLWNETRVVVEPSAGIGVAAALATDRHPSFLDETIRAAYTALGLPDDACLLTVLSGANVDFLTLPLIARKGRLSPKERRYYCFEIPERSGTLIGLLDQFLSDINIIDFQYGKTDPRRAFPVIGVEAFPDELSKLEAKLSRSPLHFNSVTNATSVEYRVVPFQPSLANLPIFATVEFPDRPGALSEFMRQIVGLTNVCYFNYTETGQSIEQALMGFEFQDGTQRDAFTEAVAKLGVSFQTIPSNTIAGLSVTE
ncbi:MAG: pyridoxal-phosphate dependent enzyme [Planctomycetaceae bacterium]|nr:pyridoxal-phosphate dependent enzyme [Planctomycetaceae bacterium]